MSESGFDARNDLRPPSQNSKVTYVERGVNQRNATSIAFSDGTHANSKPLIFETFSNETFALDKYLTRLHTNLDSRYQWPSAVVAELRKPRPSDPLKPGVSTVRRLLFNPYPLGTNRLYDELSTHIGIQAKSMKLHASYWPSPLTNHDQACLAQQFCSYFYHRYCTPLGHIKLASSNRDSPANNDQLTSEDRSRPRIASRDRSENYSECEVQLSQQRALCPFFYTGSLSEAIQLSERPSGRPWPAILLFLHNDDSPHNWKFVNSILCSLREEYTKSPAAGHPVQITGIHNSPKDRLEEQVCTGSLLNKTETVTACGVKKCKQQRTSGTVKKKDSSKGAHLAPNESVRLSFRRTTRKSATIRGQDARAFSQADTVEDKECNRHAGDPVLKEAKIDSPINHILCVMHQPERKKQQNNKPDYKSNCANDSDEVNFKCSIRKSKNLPACGEQEDPDDTTDEDQNTGKLYLTETYGTTFAKKSFRALLLERSAGLVPWDCTDARGRSYLARTFAGTRLAQWLYEWNEPEHYPILVAVGRTAERTVVCSHLRGANINILEALRWLNDVTLAHFHNFREPIIPTCPERSENLNVTPGMATTFAAERLQPGLSPQPSPSPAISCTNQTSSIARLGSPGNETSGELGEFRFASSANTPSAPKKTISPIAADDMLYRLGKSPQNQDGPLSSIFEATVDPPSDKLRERLKRVQQSFKMASATLANTISADILSCLETHFNFGGRRKLLTSSKSTSAQVILDLLHNPVHQDSQKAINSTGMQPVYLSHCQNCVESEVSRSESVLRFGRGAFMSETAMKRTGRTPETRLKRPETLSNVDGRSDNENSGQISQGEDTWWKFLACGKQVANFRVQTQFYQKFTERYTVDYPSTPAFLLGRLQTALFRAMNSNTQEQVTPILVYLHDNRAPGAEHFAANVLCSKRFTTKLFENKILIWPYDISKPAQTQPTGRRESSRAQKKVRSIEMYARNMTESGSRKSHRRTHSSFSRISHRGLPEIGKNLCDGRKEPLSDTSEKNGCGKRPTFSSRNCSSVKNSHGFTKLHATAVQRLLDCFCGHPAEESIRRIISVPILPSLINLHYGGKQFSVTHVLMPTATTKEAISWLTAVLKLYSNPQTV